MITYFSFMLTPELVWVAFHEIFVMGIRANSSYERADSGSQLEQHHTQGKGVELGDVDN